ncbi:hypothetical protein KKC08_03195 [Patescibacteria group bacterium]|nr:hypothetical protein [Patescibacteria group bacterium]MCG2702507.1 hypothetical protein [Candidatus Parcubacteria bacterium]MBU4210828.1 hypothetical protein [Patescibacteria group bacterium]MBU4264560.1 hypothetical protein [Patescibacteria group bacterium]MBU4390228.1 hypothetical protein [Patescibacteria group bacterium]
MSVFNRFLYKLNHKNIRLLPKLNSNLIYTTLAILIISVLAFSAKTKLAQEEVDVIDSVHEGESQISLESWSDRGTEEILPVNMCDLLLGECPSASTIEELNQNGQAYIPGGALGTTNNLIAGLYRPPASGIEYLASLKNNLLGKPAYAQGMGFSGLQPILSIWKAFRNVVYILSSLIFIALGLMVMFRIKSSPQTVVTIQNAIPQIIVTLILVTFSYAIAGLLIDLSNLILGAFLSVLFSSQGIPLSENLLNEDFFQWINGFTNSYNFENLIESGHTDYMQLAFLLVPKMAIATLGGLLGAVIGGILGSPVFGVGAGVGGLLGAGGGIVLFIIIITVMVLIWLMKFFFGCMKCYVVILFRIICGPLEIALGAIPGVKIGFSTWIRDITGNLAVFPISLLFLILANLIVQNTSSNPLTNPIWAPRIIRRSAVSQAAAWPSGGIIPVAIGLASLMLLSKLPLLIPQAIFMIKPTPWDNALGQTGAGFGKFMAPVGPAATSFGLTSGLNIADKGADSIADRAEELRHRGKIEQAQLDRANRVRDIIKKGTRTAETAAVHGKLMPQRGTGGSRH